MNKILIVDDDLGIRETFSKLLEKEGFDVITLGEGESVVETLRKNPVDLIILDIMLPGKSGIEVLKELKKDKELKSIPVIMFTAKDSEQTLKEAFEIGANDFIKKPVKSITELLARIRAHIKIKRYEDGLRKINLEQQLEILKQITATVGHNFGQPLTVILSYIAIIERHLNSYPELYVKLAPILSKIKNSTEDIKKIVEQLKSLTKVEITSYVESVKMLKIDTKKSPE